MDIGRSHQGSVYQLLGDYPSVDLIKAYSTNLLVNPETPKAFVSYAMDDDVVPQEYNCYAFVQALKANGVEHVDDYHETGGHSTGAFANYPSAMIDWLKSF
jgi:predicted esterase